jgi:alpha-N-arabinofuranosidase
MFTSLLSGGRGGQTFKSPFFYMYKLFSTNVNGNSLDTYVDCETFNGKVYRDIPYLDVSSSYSEDENTLVINVVNRNMEEAISTNIISDTGDFNGTAKVSTINSDNVNARYTAQSSNNYIPVTSTMEINGNSFSYSFPAHSFTQIEIELE